MHSADLAATGRLPRRRFTLRTATLGTVAVGIISLVDCRSRNQVTTPTQVVTAPTAPVDSLAALTSDLITRSRAIKTCSAQFRVTTPDGVNLIDLVYEAPNRIRVDISGPDSQQSSWLVGSHNVSRGTSNGKSLHWEVDFDELYAPWLALEDRIDGTFAARTREESSQAGQELSVRLVVDARFDDATGDGSLDFMAYTQRENDGPFSWLCLLYTSDAADE